MSPKVSVIVPIYNAEKYLEECIQSVRNQTLTNIEIILIDDESTDSSLEICNKYCEVDERIRVFSNPNIGQGLERNYGIGKAVGEYIAFLDADDSYSPNMLEILYSVATKEQADMVSCGYKDIYLDELWEKHPLPKSVLNSAVKIQAAMANLIANEKQDGYQGCIAVWDSIFKREIINKNNIAFRSERKVYSEDLLFKLDFMSHATKIVFCQEMLYNYRITDMSFTNNINPVVLERIVSLHNAIVERFGNVLKDYNLNVRMTNRTFFTVRFNIKKAIGSSEAKEFYKSLCENENLIKILKNYRSRTIKNYLVWVLVNLKNEKLIYAVLKKLFR